MCNFLRLASLGGGCTHNTLPSPAIHVHVHVQYMYTTTREVLVLGEYLAEDLQAVGILSLTAIPANLLYVTDDTQRDIEDVRIMEGGKERRRDT